MRIASDACVPVTAAALLVGGLLLLLAAEADVAHLHPRLLDARRAALFVARSVGAGHIVAYSPTALNSVLPLSAAPPPPPPPPNALLMADWRRNEDIFLALGTACPHLDASWEMLVYCAPTSNDAGHCDWVRARLAAVPCVPRIAARVVQATEWEFPGNNFHLRNVSFWRALPYEHILVLHADAAMCARARLPLSTFTRFSYVGAPWAPPPLALALKGAGGIDISLRRTRDGEISTMRVFQGNGGLSLRDRTLMIRCLETYDVGPSEDLFFAACARTWSRQAPAPAVYARLFAWETGAPLRGTLGTHGVCTYNKELGCNRRFMRQWLRYCPESGFLFPGGRCANCDGFEVPEQLKDVVMESFSGDFFV